MFSRRPIPRPAPQFWPVDEHGNRIVREGCQTFSGSWGYHREEESWKSTKTLLWLLVDSVSKGGNLLLNVGPNARGEFDERSQESLRGIATWMRLNSRSIYDCTQSECIPPPDCRMHKKAKAVEGCRIASGAPAPFALAGCLRQAIFGPPGPPVRWRSARSLSDLMTPLSTPTPSF